MERRWKWLIFGVLLHRAGSFCKRVWCCQAQRRIWPSVILYNTYDGPLRRVFLHLLSLVYSLHLTRFATQCNVLKPTLCRITGHRRLNYRQIPQSALLRGSRRETLLGWWEHDG